MSRQQTAFLIIGAGPTGLGAARQLHLSGVDDWLLIDGAPTPGGLASSFTDDKGFTWDIGGHVQFSHYRYFDHVMDELLGQDGWLHHERESWVWIRDRFIPYPFQNNIRHLPKEDLHKCLQGLVEILRHPQSQPENFGQWIEATFGAGLAEVFMRPYNFKVWAYPPELMNAKWVGERVAQTDLARVLRNLVLGLDDVSWGPNNTFRFPKYGGTGSIWRACAEKLPQDRILLNSQVTSIDIHSRWVTLADGRCLHYEHLISTIPVTELIALSAQQQFAGLAERGFRFSSSHIVGLGLEGRPSEPLATKCWMYFPEANCPFYRTTVFSNYSPYNVPDHTRQWSLMAEVSESPHKPVDHARLIEDVIDGALATKLIRSRSEIVSTWKYHARYGYPTPGLERDAAIEAIIPFFEQHSVHSRGRFGLWRYEVSNQDHSFMQGVELVERLLHGLPEITGFDPNYANSCKHPWPYERWKPLDTSKTHLANPGLQ